MQPFGKQKFHCNQSWFDPQQQATTTTTITIHKCWEICDKIMFFDIVLLFNEYYEWIIYQLTNAYRYKEQTSVTNLTNMPQL